MNLANLPARSKDGHVHVLVEIPKGSRNKYEYKKEWGVIVLDRVLYSAVHYPTDYGFVPQTRSEDGESLDAPCCRRRSPLDCEGGSRHALSAARAQAGPRAAPRETHRAEDRDPG